MERVGGAEHDGDRKTWGEETARAVLNAILRRFRRRLRWNVWKTVKDALPDYNNLKDLYKRINSHFKKKKKKKKGSRSGAGNPVLEPAAPTGTPWPTRPMLCSHGWAILSRVPIVSDPGEEDFMVEWRVPLVLSSIVTRRELVSPVPVAAGQDKYPYVVALDEKGDHFLLRALPADEDALAFMLCKTATGEATPLPAEFAERLALLNVGDIGLACAGVDHLVVVALRPLPGGSAMLERFHVSSDEHPWEEPVDVGFPLGLGDRPWGSNGVVSHGGRLCYIDLAQGLLDCEPLEDVPEMVFVLLPGDTATAVAGADIAKRRAVTVSDGRVMFAELADEPQGGVVIKTWSLRLGMDGASEWTPRMQVRSSLFGSHTVLAFLHPTKPDVVSFCVSFGFCSWILLYDLATESLVDACPLALPSVPGHMLSHTFFYALAK